jgi:spore coat protein U-like protein
MKKAILAVLVMAAVSAAPALAATATSNFNVTATVAVNCTISSANVAFGAYDPVVTHAAADLDGTGSVTIACTKGSVTPIGLDLGSNASGSTRRMTDGTDFLTYELYSDAGRTTVWGNANPDWVTPAAAPDKNPRAITIYGRVPQAQDVEAGSYSDTVTATVNF